MNQASAQEPIIKLALPLSMVYALLQGASSMPWEQSKSVITNVHGQVCDQLSPASDSAQPVEAKAEPVAPAAEVVAAAETQALPAV